MQALDQLYREVILDHNRNPRNFGELDPPCEHADAYNPLCGDRLELTFRLADKQLLAFMFSGAGCALSQASASLLSVHIQNLSVEQAQQLINNFTAAFVGESETAPSQMMDLPSDLAALLGAREFPSRTDCVLLAWRALGQALKDYQQPI